MLRGDTRLGSWTNRDSAKLAGDGPAGDGASSPLRRRFIALARRAAELGQDSDQAGCTQSKAEQGVPVEPYLLVRTVHIVSVTVLFGTGAGTAFLMRHDRRARVNFAAAQSDLGRALYARYHIERNAAYLPMVDGRAYTESAGCLRLCRVVGGPWRLFRVAAAIPETLRDAACRVVARNRYR